MVYLSLMRYVNLNDEEREKLEKLYRSSSKHHFRQRCQTILQSSEGMSVPQLSRMFNVRTRTIYSWMDRWIAFGVEGLQILPGRGVKAKLKTSDSDLVDLVKKKQSNLPEH